MVNDARIKSCIARYDIGAHGAIKCGAYTCVQFLRAVSHSVGAHAVPAAATDASDTDDDDDQDVNGSNQLQSLWLSILTFPAFSTPANWSRIFMSRNFHLCKLVPQIHVSHFQSPRSVKKQAVMFDYRIRRIRLLGLRGGPGGSADGVLLRK